MSVRASPLRRAKLGRQGVRTAVLEGNRHMHHRGDVCAEKIVTSRSCRKIGNCVGVIERFMWTVGIDNGLARKGSGQPREVRHRSSSLIERAWMTRVLTVRQNAVLQVTLRTWGRQPLIVRVIALLVVWILTGWDRRGELVDSRMIGGSR